MCRAPSEAQPTRSHGLHWNRRDAERIDRAASPAGGMCCGGPLLLTGGGPLPRQSITPEMSPEPRTTWRAGLVDALAFLPSVSILGVVFGASVGLVGVSGPGAVLMSALVFSGAGQFAALPLWPQGGAVIVLSVFVLSLRFCLITASMAPMLVGASRLRRAILAYCVTDENYALAVTRGGGRLVPAYLVGSWIPLYFGWLIGTVIGVLVGAQVPAGWVGPLKSVFPLLFLVLTVLLCTSVRLAVVAVLGGVFSIVGAALLPPAWNVIGAGLAASLIGVLLDRVPSLSRPSASPS